jgi:hypothetical protein
VSVMKTADGRELHLLSVTSVVENPDGSLDVSSGAHTTQLEGEDAEAFTQATQRVASPPFEQQMPGPTLLESVRAQSG